MMGHLIDQVTTHHGLADKNDDMIEKAHQPWKREKERTWNIKCFKDRQRAQLKSMRKRYHYKIAASIEKVNRKRRRVYKNRSSNPVARSAMSSRTKRIVKQEKRQAFGQLQPQEIDVTTAQGHGLLFADSDSDGS